MLRSFSRPTVEQTREAIIFNFRRPTRARLIGQGGGGSLWLVEAFDPLHKVWVWQSESHDQSEAVNQARQMSLFPAS